MKKPESAPKMLVEEIAKFYHGEWGFTGTRAGMHAFQIAMVRRVFRAGQPIVLRHGGAFGADFEAHAMWREVCKTSACNVWPADAKRAALFMGQERVKVEPVMPPLDRNIEIVKRSTFLVATPSKEVEEQRSGTWQTIREAAKINVPVLIIWPLSQRLTLWFESKLHRVSYTRLKE